MSWPQGSSKDLSQDLSVIADDQQTPRSSLSGTQDLISLFDLKPYYETYVKPYTAPAHALNGSGREDRLKFEKGYHHLVVDLPGRYGNQRDSFMRDIAFYPDFQPLPDMPDLDQETLRESFSLQPGVMENVDAVLGIVPDKEKRKKNKRSRTVRASLDFTHSRNASREEESIAGEPSKKKRKP